MAEPALHPVRPWTISEEKALTVLASLGIALLVVIFERPSNSIRKKASRLGVSVKRISEISDTDLTHAQLEHVRRINGAALCPSCARRFAAIKSTGLCGVCHKDELIKGHHATLAELEKQREVNRLKSRVRHRRKELGITAPRSRRKK